MMENDARGLLIGDPRSIFRGEYQRFDKPIPSVWPCMILGESTGRSLALSASFIASRGAAHVYLACDLIVVLGTLNITSYSLAVIRG
jgi:hypothetical protein